MSSSLLRRWSHISPPQIPWLELRIKKIKEHGSTRKVKRESNSSTFTLEDLKSPWPKGDDFFPLGFIQLPDVPVIGFGGIQILFTFNIEQPPTRHVGSVSENIITYGFSIHVLLTVLLCKKLNFCFMFSIFLKSTSFRPQIYLEGSSTTQNPKRSR